MGSILLAGFMPALPERSSCDRWHNLVVLIIVVSTAIAMLSISFTRETKDLDLSNIDGHQAV
jgi:hypothetical protein